MAIAHSRLTAQGQISVPVTVRRKLGVGPGSVLEWIEEDDQVIVRRAGRYSSADVHNALFSQGKTRTRRTVDTRDGIRKYIRKRHSRR
jgi:AbrB family looped-hinge helix DNA binding protein